MATVNPQQLGVFTRKDGMKRYPNSKEGNLSVPRADVVGALLISSQIKSQLFAMNKDSQWENQPPPPGARWSAFRAPPDPPPGPCPIWQGLRVLRPPSIITICGLHVGRVTVWSETTCGIRAFIFECFTQDCEHHTGHHLNNRSAVINRLPSAFNEECNL